MSSSSDEDDNFLRLHAKAIAQALQQQDAVEQQAGMTNHASSSKSQRDRMVHDTYIALCYDDPRVESDLACQYLAMALVDPKSPYALSGPLVEGVRQLCAKQLDNNTTSGTTPKAANNNNTQSLVTSPGSNSAKGSALLAWAIFAKIPLMCCQASDRSQVDCFLGSYRPPPPPNPPATGKEDKEALSETIQNKSKELLGEEADRLAAMLSGEPENENETTNNDRANDDNYEEEVWAAESDPSDFEFESGFSYEQQVADVEDTFAEWMIDRTDPIKLSKPATPASWKQVRHAVMDLTAQLNYRQVASLWGSNTQQNIQGLMGTRGPADLLTQFTLTLLVPPKSSSTTTKPSVFDFPDEEQDVLQPQRQLQAMAWHPLGVMRDAATATANTNTTKALSEYLSMLQTLIAIDNASGGIKKDSPMAPATYLGLASLSALCQEFSGATSNANANTNQQLTVERYRILRRSVWGVCDDLAHAMEREESIRKAAAAAAAPSDGQTNNTNWIVWTLLPLFEILTNQRLQTGTTIVAKADSVAQKHHNQQQAGQQWSAGLLQSGLFRFWLLKCQELRAEETEASVVLWQFTRRSLLFLIAQSMSSTSALGKYAWRFPNFTSVAEIGESFYPSNNNDSNEVDVDDILFNLLSMELAGSVAASGPTIQWKSKATSTATTIKPLPSRLECQKVSWTGFQALCRGVVRVLELACQEENKKENVDTTSSSSEEKVSTLSPQEDKLQHQMILRGFERFVSCLAACPLLARLFVHDIQPSATASSPSDGSGTVSKCLDDIQKALSQYKAPAPELGNGPKAKNEDGSGAFGEGQGVLESSSRAAKDQVQDASLQEEIHAVRKDLKVLRSVVATTTVASSTTTSVPQDLTSSSKTD